MNKGLFITLEGGDGCGKTTQGKLIYEYLIGQGLEVVRIREPGGTEIGEKIRDIILDKDNFEMNNITEIMLYAAARAQIVSEIIKPSLEQGKIVLCDRFIDSSYAYQGYGRGIDLDTITAINKAAMDDIYPDITLFFDLNPKKAIERRVAEREVDRLEMENASFHQRVYEGYCNIAKREPERFFKINAENSIDDVFSDAKNILDEAIRKWRSE